MAVQVSYPGVYIDEFAPGAPIEGVGTSTAGFVGVAAKGPTVPTLIQSWDAFVEIFGGYIEEAPTGFLAPAVYGFFLNGGTACYVLRVATGKPASANLANRTGPGTPPVMVAASIAEGPTSTIKVQVLDASRVESMLKAVAGPTVLKIVTATTTVSGPLPADLNALKVASIASFDLGDRVHLTQGANNEIATVKSIDTATSTITFTAPVPATVRVVGATVIIENLAKGRKRFRVEKVPKFVLNQALPAGATVKISQTTPAKEELAVVESAGIDSVTLRTGLANDYDQSNPANKLELTSLEFTLIVDDGATVERFDELAVNSVHLRYWRHAVNSQLVTLTATDAPQTVADLRPKVGVYTLGGGVADDRTAAWAAFLLKPADTLDLFRAVDEIAIVAVPGETDAAVQQAVRDHCESMADRFGILDGVHDATSGFDDLKLQFAQVRSQRGYVALYYPWLRARNPLTGDTDVLPPSGHMAGVYANTDQKRGVHKAPANVNVRGALGLERRLTDAQHGPLNLMGIDILRVFPTEAQPVVWGARTTATDANWQYVNIRRLFIFLEESIQEGIRWALFEPNNLQLWQKLSRSITEFLTRVWKDGALFGATPKEAFYVRIDEALNPPSERALGRLTIEIGVKPSYPAEFIIVRIGIWQGGSDVSES